MPEQGRHFKHLTARLQPRAQDGIGVQVGIEHHHLPAHLHFMGHTTGHPNRPLRRHHPIAEVGEHFQRTGGGIGELPTRVRVPLENSAIGVFA